MSAELERLASSCIFPGFEGPNAPDWVRRRVAEGLGGVVLYAWNVEDADQLRGLTDTLRSERPDLLVAIDEEGGDVTRVESGTGSSYPGNAALGAIDDVELTERVAASMAAALVEVGVNLDFAPVADVNTNPDNPVIGIRAFGAKGDLVARHVAAFVRGLQDGGVAACPKHFPGHGDTAVDSHLALPFVAAIDDQALRPFAAAIDAGALSIMTAHIVVRAVDNVPATMSREILSSLLRERLGFAGMVMTDALEMKAISDTVGVEEGAVRALAAGADAVCVGHDLFDESVVAVRDALVAAVDSGRLDESRLAEASERVAAVASWAGEPTTDGAADDALGRDAARRALLVDGPVPPARPAFVVELEPEAGMAAGRLAQAPAEWFCAVAPGSSAFTLHEDDVDTDLHVDGRQLVIIARDAHRHPWQRDAIGTLVAREPSAIVVEIGLPRWRPAGVATYLATYGAARVNVQAAAERLYSGSRRGVEQSGSSPGS